MGRHSFSTQCYQESDNMNWSELKPGDIVIHSPDNKNFKEFYLLLKSELSDDRVFQLWLDLDNNQTIESLGKNELVYQHFIVLRDGREIKAWRNVMD